MMLTALATLCVLLTLHTAPTPHMQPPMLLGQPLTSEAGPPRLTWADVTAKYTGAALSEASSPCTRDNTQLCAPRPRLISARNVFILVLTHLKDLRH